MTELKSIKVTDRYATQSVGKNYKCIPLDKISSISLAYSETFWLLPVGLIFIAAGLFMLYALHDPSAVMGGITVALIGVAFTASYFLGRKHTISLASNSLTIEESTSGVNSSAVDDFIETVQTMIVERGK